MKLHPIIAAAVSLVIIFLISCGENSGNESAASAKKMAEPVQLIILGGPGAGKGTQSDKINETYAIPHISTGDILREEVAKETKIGKQVEDVMERGELVADSIVLNLVEQRLRQPDTKSGFILDGFPRTIPQAKGLENILDKQGREDVKVILLEVSDEEMMNRLLDRGREDDTRKVIQNRIETYHQQTEQVIDYYQKRGNLIRINGEQSIEGVSKDIQSALSK